jgi:imidazolonepropionase-like amidohydrolase
MSRRSPATALSAILFILVILVAASGTTFREVPAGGGGEAPAVIIRGVRLFDGSRLVPRTDVVFEGGRITAVGSKAKAPAGAEVIDGAGKTLLPGLIDAHVHVIAAEALRQSVVFGVTAVIDMFTSADLMRSMKDDQAAGRAEDRAFFVSPGILATAPGGHGTQFGLEIPTLRGPSEARAFVDARVADGSDFIKIILDDGSAYSFPRPTLDMATVSALIEAAHARGKTAVIHAATLKNCRDVLEAGVDGLAHLFFDGSSDPEFGRIAARKKAFIIPTLSVIQGLGDQAMAAAVIKDKDLAPYLKPGDLQTLQRTFGFRMDPSSYRAAESAIPLLKAAGVPILAGTDAPNPGTAYGASLHGELALLVQAGLTPLEALRTATSVPAKTFGLVGRGLVAAGAVADLVLVNGDPSTDIRLTRDIVAVWKNGRRIDRDQYQRTAAAERDKASAAPPARGPEYSRSGLVSDFEGQQVSAAFGSGWMISTDTMAGGKSKAQMRLAEDGADGSAQALLVTGDVIPGGANLWAGAFFSPGPAMMTPADLSSSKGISFWAKGEGPAFAVMLFARSRGFIPAARPFSPGTEWRKFEFPFADFGLKGDDIMGIFIGASGKPGPFTLRLDDFRIE